MVDDVLWYSVKVRELALFPLKAGRLAIGPMTMDFEGPRYSSRRNPNGTRRQTQPLTVKVTEPPIAGRPPGYQIGDVGQFHLDATVEPRQVPAGGAVSVVATLQGTGKVGGTRRLSYIVELQRSGTVDLGALTLPFYDPAARRYDVARARLGSVVVTPSADGTKATAQRSSDPLAALMQPRHKLGPPPTSPNRLSERGLYWLLLAMGPLSVVLSVSLVPLGRNLSNRWKSRRRDPKKVVLRLLREARDLDKAGQAEQAVARVEKAILSAVELATGLKARGVLRSELAQQLGARGVGQSLALQIAELLERCEQLRFTHGHEQPTSSLVSEGDSTARSLLRIRLSEEKSSS